MSDVGNSDGKSAVSGVVAQTSLPPAGPRRTDEQIATAIQLSSIFNPEASRQRYEAFGRQGLTGAVGEYMRFAHYTSAEGAIGILQSKRLWMRNTTCMADYREVQHGFEILQRWFNEKNTKNFIDTFDQIIPGAAGTALQNFNKWWADLNAYKVFVTSMSEHLMSDDQHGRLSMWRGFGNNAKVRVALVLRLPVGSLATEATSLIFSPVSYLREPEVGDAMQEVIKRAREKSDFLKQQPPGVIQALLFSTLYAGVTCLKHEGFKEEQEWRAVYNPQAWSSPLIESEMKVIDGVPQEIKKIPLGSDTDPRLYDLDVRSVLDRVIIGPSHFPYAIAQAFIGELKKLGVDNSEGMVFASGTPIR